MIEATPTDEVSAFVERWRPGGGSERSNYQLFLTELCDLLGVPRPDPAHPDNAGNHYVFERYSELCHLRVLDPACGSGNFLYVTLEHMKRLEGEVLELLESLAYAIPDHPWVDTVDGAAVRIAMTVAAGENASTSTEKTAKLRIQS